jgi:hypothetical protein
MSAPEPSPPTTTDAGIAHGVRNPASGATARRTSSSPRMVRNCSTMKTPFFVAGERLRLAV